MKIDYLEIWNVFSYDYAVIDFDNTDFSIFVGKTGSGKSAIFDAISWVLYDKTARKNYNKKKVLRDVPDRQSFCEGHIYFTSDQGIIYRVERNYTGKNSSLKLFRDDKDISYRTPTLVQEQIEEAIGVDHDTFLNIVYFSQGDIGKFLTSDSAKRIQLISDLLKLDIFDKALKICSNKITSQEKEISNFIGQISVLTEQIAEIDIKGLQRKKKQAQSSLDVVIESITEISQWINNAQSLKSFQEKLVAKKKEYEIQKENSEELLRQKKEQINKHQSKKKELIKIRSEVEKNKDIVLRYNEIVADNNKISIQINELKRKMVKYATNIKNHTDNINSLETLIVDDSGKPCPYCKNLIDESSVKNLKEIIRNTGIKSKTIKMKAGKVEKQIRNYEKLHAAGENEREKLESKRDKAIQLAEREAQCLESVGHLKIEQSRYDHIKAKAKEKLAKIKADYQQIKKDIKLFGDDFDVSLLDKKNAKFDKLEYTRKQLEKDIGQYRFRQQQATSKVKKLAIIKKDAESKQIEFDILVKWKSALPLIKLNMIHDIIPFIQTETNKNLSELLKGKRILFKVEPDKLTNRLSIDIEDYEHHIKRPFEGWSGGQKAEMALSVFLALNKLASLRSGKKLNFLILDEKFSSIDSESRNTVIEILKEQQAGKKIWVISHVENIDVHFNQVFKATMNDGVSKLEQVK
jgi:exonuclease SbcC